MRILFVSQYFPPEIEPSASKIYELSVKMAARGHQITVITGFPNYPTGIIPKEYRWRLWMVERKQGINVLRVPIIPSSNKQFLRRIAGEISFLISSLIASLFIAEHDAIITSSPPLEIGLAGYLISIMRRKPFIFEVRDPLPQQAIAVGILKNKILIRIAEWIEMVCYRKSRKVIVVTRRFGDHVASKGIDRKKIVFIPNGADTEAFSPLRNGELIRDRYHLSAKFVVSYIGTLGRKHNAAAVLEAAMMLREERGVVFLFVGEGAEKEKLLQITQDNELKNVILEEPQPRADIPGFINASDVGIITLQNTKELAGVLPVRMFEYMACGCTILLSANGESKELLESSGAGIWVGPGESERLVDVILMLYRNRRLCEEYGANGRQYVMKNFSRQRLCKKYERVLHEAVRSQ